jgi:hypothetical protein
LTVTAKDEKNLRIFERQILRKISGPVYIDNACRTNSKETDKLMECADIMRYIKAQRIMAGAYPKNGPSKTNYETIRMETYGN